MDRRPSQRIGASGTVEEGSDVDIAQGVVTSAETDAQGRLSFGSGRDDTGSVAMSWAGWFTTRKSSPRRRPQQVDSESHLSGKALEKFRTAGGGAPEQQCDYARAAGGSADLDRKLEWGGTI